ncbi:MAG: DUF1080 domain-containing protein, partial [Planctomycetota bacterium]
SIAGADDPSPLGKQNKVATAKKIAMFDGNSLKGWRGRKDLWSVADGAIVGKTSKEKPIKGNTFLIWQNGTPGDFEMLADFLISSGNSGIQYRSKVINEDKFVVGGYQADIDFALKFAGINYEEKGRGILALRGEKATIGADGKKNKEKFGDTDKMGSVIKPGQWNRYRIVAKGNTLTHYINDVMTSQVVDNQPSKAAGSGVIALQLHQGPAMEIRFKNLFLTPLK